MSRYYIDTDALIRYGKRGTLVYWEDILNAPSIGIDLAEDGTLSVEVEDATRVARVFVEDGKNGDLYYADKSEEYEWCHDCKEYDTEKHCCPRWNKVIRQTLAELEADRSERWIPCSERMPKEDGEYLVSLAFEWGNEIEMGWLLDGEWVNPNSHVTVAWMPLPEPWEGADDE